MEVGQRAVIHRSRNCTEGWIMVSQTEVRNQMIQLLLPVIEWRSMESAPRDSRWIEVECEDGSVHRAHYACDLSGEDQPAFEGWFEDCVSWYRQVRNVVGWRMTCQITEG